MNTRQLVAIALLSTPLLGCAAFVEFAANSAGLPSPAKRVGAKSPPDLLIADDGSECRVPESRFRQIDVGDHITCLWSATAVRRH